MRIIRYTSLLLAASFLTVSLQVQNVFAGAESIVDDRYAYSEDFAAFDSISLVDAKASKPGEAFNTDWGVSSKYTSDGELNVSGAKGAGATSTGAMILAGQTDAIGTVNFKNTDRLADGYRFSINANYASLSGYFKMGFGVRFMVDEDSDTYYELASAKDSRFSPKVSFVKVKNGSEVVGTRVTGTVGVTRTDKVTFEVSVSSGVVSYNVHAGSLSYLSGTYNDGEPLEYTSSTVPVAAYIYGGAAKIEFDDFEISQTIPYIDTEEPPTVLYRDAAIGKKLSEQDGKYILDLGEKNIVRRISFAAATDVGDVEISDDGINYTLLAGAEDFASSTEWLNRENVSRIRYIRLHNNKLPHIYTDISGHELCGGVGGHDSLAMYDGGSASDITWSCDNSELCSVENGSISFLKPGTVNITAQKGTKKLVVTYTIKREIDYADETGRGTEYLAKVLPIVSAVDTAIASEDEAALESVIFSTGEVVLSDILDLDLLGLDDLNENARNLLIRRIMVGGQFSDGSLTIDNVRTLISTVQSQIMQAPNAEFIGKIVNATAGSDTEALKMYLTGGYETGLEIDEYLDKILFEEDLTDEELLDIAKAAVAQYRGFDEVSANVNDGAAAALVNEIVSGVNELVRSFVFEDDFSYADGVDATSARTFGTGEAINDNWTVSAQFNSYSNITAKMAESEFYPSSGGALRYHGFGPHVGTINLRNIPELVGKYKIELDQNKYDGTWWDTSMGIRFMMNESTNTYYEIFVKKAFSNTVTFQKVFNGNVIEASVNESAENEYATGIKRIHYEVSVAGDIIEYKLSRGGVVFFSGSYKENSPIEYTSAVIPVAAYVSGDNVDVEIDNVKLTQISKPYLELPEPSPVIYNNEAKNAEVDGNIITFGRALPVRRIRFDSLSSICNVEASVDGEEWDALVQRSEFINGEWLNRISNRKYKYLRLENSTNVQVYTDVYENDELPLYIGKDADLALYVLGAKEDGVSWTVSDPSVAYIKNGMLRARRAGRVTVTAKYGKNNYSTTYIVKSKMNEEAAAGRLQEYLDAVRPLYASINDAVIANDRLALKSALLDVCNNTIYDFDTSAITDLSDGALDILSARILADGSCGEISLTSLNKLFDKIYEYAPKSKVADVIIKIIDAATNEDAAGATAVYDGSALSVFENEIEFVSSADISSVDADNLLAVAKLFAAEYRGFDQLQSTLVESDVQTFMNNAKEMIKTQRYINVLKAANAAITSNNAAALEAVISGSGRGQMGTVDIFNAENVESISDSDRIKLAGRLITYGEFKAGATEALDDVLRLIKAIDIEFAVGCVSGIEDAEKFGTALENYNEYLKLPLDDEYYTLVKSDTLAALAGKSFANYAELDKLFKDDFIIRSFKAISAYQKFAALYAGYSVNIGCDEVKLAEIITKEGAAMYSFCTYVKKNQSSTDSLSDMAGLVDAYTIGTTQVGGGGAGGGGVSSSGGYGSESKVSSNSGLSVALNVVDLTNTDKSNKVEASVYGDVATDHWAYQFIKYLNAHGSVSGYEDGNFCPNNNVTRAEFAKIIMNEFGFDIAEIITSEDAKRLNAEAVAAAEEGSEPELILATEKPFEDVELGQWYAKYIITAKENGLLNGDGKNCYPNDNITREEMVSIIYRILLKKGVSLDNVNLPKKFADEDSISDWAYAPFMQLYKFGVISGLSDTLISPKEFATRAQSAKVIGDLSMKIRAKEAAVNE